MQRILIALAILLFARTASASTYAGGTLITSPRLVLVDWGGQLAAPEKAAAEAVDNALSRSPSVVNWLQQYNIQNQTFATWTPFNDYYAITPFNKNTSLNDVGAGWDVRNEIVNQLLFGYLPQETSSTIYVVHLPVGYTVHTAAGDSCVSGGWCGIHWFDVNQIKYAIIPDLTTGYCSQHCGETTNTTDQNLQAVISHEVLETVTDPYANGWTGPEIGDPCNATITPGRSASLLYNPLGGYTTTQKMWSNKDNACAPLEPTTLCCETTGAQTPCTSVGQGETCSINGNNTTNTSVPIVTGSVYSLQVRTQVVSSWQPTIAAPACNTSAIFSGAYSPMARSQATACFQLPVNGNFPNLVQSCIGGQKRCASGYVAEGGGVCCAPDTSFINSHNALCGYVANLEFQ
jgi:hypothetical protein